MTDVLFTKHLTKNARLLVYDLLSKYSVRKLGCDS